MPITTDLGGKNYVLGRGRLYFDRFTPAQVAAGIVAATRGEGERYIGNSPEFGFTSSEEKLDHYDSDTGVKTKDDSVPLQLDRTGTFKTENIDVGNIALLLLSSGASTVTQTAQTAQTFLVPGAKQGLFYQIGATASLPAGVRSISNVVVKKGAGFTTTVTAATNYEVDEVRGRIIILAGSSAIPDNTDLQVTYDIAATSREQVISGNTSIYGALRFVSDNPKGKNRDYYMPYVKLAPDGDYALKGDSWQQIGFTMELLKKASNIEAIYADGIPV